MRIFHTAKVPFAHLTALWTRHFSFVVVRRLSSIIIYIGFGSKLWFPALWLDTLSFVVLSYFAKNDFPASWLPRPYPCTRPRLFIFVARAFHLFWVDTRWWREIALSMFPFARAQTHRTAANITSTSRTYCWRMWHAKSKIEKYFGLIHLPNSRNHNSLISERKFTHRNDFAFFFRFNFSMWLLWVRFPRVALDLPIRDIHI